MHRFKKCCLFGATDPLLFTLGFCRGILLKTVLSCVAAFGILLTPPVTVAEEQAPLHLVATIPLPEVKGEFDLMAVDLPGKRLFVAATDNNTVEILNFAENQKVRSLTAVNQPKWIVYRPELKKAYISNAGNGTVGVFTGHPLALNHTLKFKEKCNNLRYYEKTKELYVSVGKTFGSIGIVRTSPKGDEVVGEVPLADFPKQFELEQNGNRIFVNVPSANHVAVIDREQRKVIATWPVREEKENVPMSLDEPHHRLFIGCDPGKFVVLDTSTGKSVASLPIAAGADGIYCDAARQLIYISCGAGFIEIVRQVDADHYQSAGKIPTAAGAGTSLFVPAIHRLFLAVPEKGTQKAEIRVYDTQP